MIEKLADILMRCDGIRIQKITTQSSSGVDYSRYEYFKTGDIVVPDNVYIEITMTSTKGTIGKLIALDVGTSRAEKEISSYWVTYIIQVKSRKGTNRIHQSHAKVLKNHDGSTKWVRTVKKKTTEVIPLQVNKYKQTINKGDWLAGIGPGKVLYFGQVTRWSHSSVWVNPTPSIPKSKEHCINRPLETIVLPIGIDYEQIVTIMALSGWRR